MKAYVFTRIIPEEFRLLYATGDAAGVTGETEDKRLALELPFLDFDAAVRWIRLADPARHWLAVPRASDEEVKHHRQLIQQNEEKVSWMAEWERRHEEI